MHDPLLYVYSQNNSGGEFIFDEQWGLYVFIEAGSAVEADRLAEDVAGIYFDGVEAHRDCPCCGDRWGATWQDPMPLGQHLEYVNWAWGGWCVVYYKDDSRWYVTSDHWMWSDYKTMKAYRLLTNEDNT